MIGRPRAVVDVKKKARGKHGARRTAFPRTFKTGEKEIFWTPVHYKDAARAIPVIASIAIALRTQRKFPAVR